MTSKYSQRPHRKFDFVPQGPQAEGMSATLDLRSLWRHAGLIFLIASVFPILAVMFVTLRSPWYTASTRIIVDHRNLQLTQENSTFMTSALTGPLVDSQVEILRSQRVAARALELLAPLSVADLLPRPKRVSRILDTIGLKKLPVLSDEQKHRLAVYQLQQLLSIRRIGETFTIEISARSRDPVLAASIATATSDAYLEDQAQANAEAARGASPWLRERLKNSGTTARVISKATPPFTPDGPRLLHIVVASTLAGLAFAIGAALAYDLLDKRVRRPEQASFIAQAEFVGILPRMKEELPGEFGWAMDYPRSTYTQTLNRVCVVSMIERQSLRTLGITSCFKGEGKTTVAINLARIAASNGHRVLLVDAAVNTRDLSRQLASKAKAGLSEVLKGDVDLQKAILEDPETGLHFVGLTGDSDDTSALWLWGNQRSKLMELSSKYDAVIFDLPAIADDCTAAAAVQSLDSMLLVAEYGRLRMDAALSVLSQAGNAYKNFLGVVMNKVDEESYNRYYAS